MLHTPEYLDRVAALAAAAGDRSTYRATRRALQRRKAAREIGTALGGTILGTLALLGAVSVPQLLAAALGL